MQLNNAVDSRSDESIPELIVASHDNETGEPENAPDPYFDIEGEGGEDEAGVPTVSDPPTGG